MGGGGKGSDAPDPPDYQQAAREQGIENRETARLNAVLGNPNYITPWGSQTVSWGNTFNEDAYNAALENYQNELAAWENQGAGGPRFGSAWERYPAWGGGRRGQRPIAPNRSDYISRNDQATVNIDLSPEQQQLLDSENRLALAYAGLAEDKLPQLTDAYSQPFEFSDVTDLRDKTEGALMDRLNPYLDRDIEAKRTELLQAGFTPGSEGWIREMDDYNRRSNDARLAVIGQAGTEQDRALAAASYLRNLPLQEINALRTGAPVAQPSFPGYAGSAAQPAPIFNAANQQYQGDVAAYNAGQAGKAGFTSGLFNLAGAALPYAASSFGIPGASIWSPGGSPLSNAGPVQLFGF